MKVVFHITNHARKEVCHLRFVHREGIQTNDVSCGTRSCLTCRTVSSGVTRLSGVVFGSGARGEEGSGRVVIRRVYVLITQR